MRPPARRQADRCPEGVTANGVREDTCPAPMWRVAPRHMGVNPWPGTHGQDAHPPRYASLCESIPAPS